MIYRTFYSHTDRHNFSSIFLVCPTKPLLYVRTGKDKDHDREFWFDFCFMEDSLQESVYSALGRPVLRQAFEGFNGTIFAYGQVS